jgi:salicyloyl-CoA 5-hydroxylase
MRVVCVGAGPGGLYAALLLKQRRPEWSVTVLEQNGPDETFGFGVVFSEPTLERLRAADPETHAALLGIGERWDPIELRLRGGVISCSGQGFVAAGRQALLTMLYAKAIAAGVDLRFHAPVDADALPDADVLVASDGARSSIRRRFASTFEPSIDVGRSKFIWFGTTKRFECLTFLFESAPAGAFAVHAYPFGDGRSTFIVETDEASLANAGIDTEDREESERVSLAYCERVFAHHLDGHRLLANRSRWANFRTIRNQTWRAGRVVLLGDSAHTVHFSMGSGTKLALEDALALSDALCSNEDVDAALAAYEAARRPDARKLQATGRPSLFWWESFRHLMDRDLEPFAFHFLTRNLRVTRESILRRDPELVRRVEAWHQAKYGGDASRGALGLPLEIRGLRLDNRLVTEDAEDGAASLLMVPLAALLESAQATRRHGRALGVRVSADELGGADLAHLSGSARVDWLELSLSPADVARPILEQVRATWSGPLSVSLDPAGCPLDELVALGELAARAGVDLVSLAWRGKGQPEVVATAEALRFVSPVLIGIDPREAGADPDTLLLSGRADLFLVRPGSAEAP